MENVCNLLKQMFTKFLDNSNLMWDEFLPCVCYFYNIFPSRNGTKSPFFLMFGWDLAERCLSHLKNSNRYYGTYEGRIVLEELHKVWKHYTNHVKEMHHRNEHMDQKISKIIQNLRLASWSWSRTMHITCKTKVSISLQSTENI